MIENIPEWITNLALDIYKVIQKYNAMPRFSEMVNTWTKSHEAESSRLKTWKEKRKSYFEQTVINDLTLQDENKQPEQDWQFEHHCQHLGKKTESGNQYNPHIIHGWVPPELSNSAKPEITHPLPLRRGHTLAIIEKYAILAAVYECGRKGTEKLSLLEFPNDWREPDALSNIIRSISFEILCDATSKLDQGDEEWLKAMLDDIEKDMSNWTTGELSQPKKKKQTVSSETRTDKCIKKIKDNLVISIIIILGIIIIALGAVAGGLDNILSFWNKIAHSSTESTDIFADVSKDGTILRSKNFPWKITKTKHHDGNIIYLINGRQGVSTAISVFPDNSTKKYFVRNAIDGMAIVFTCSEEKISNFTIKVKY